MKEKLFQSAKYARKVKNNFRKLQKKNWRFYACNALGTIVISAKFEQS